MRMTRAVLVAVAGLGLALTGCEGTGTTGNGASSGAPSGGTPSGTAPSGGGSSGAASGVAAQCMVGTWTSTGLDASINQSGATGTITGGEGYTLTVAPDGRTTVDFAGMKPVVFATAVGGAQIKGNFTYGGKVNGTLNTPTATATSGTLEPVGKMDFGGLTVSVDLTSPVQTQLAKNLPIAQLAGISTAQTGNAVDQQPVLRRSTYRCGGATLTLGPPDGTSLGGTWTLKKV